MEKKNHEKQGMKKRKKRLVPCVWEPWKRETARSGSPCEKDETGESVDNKWKSANSSMWCVWRRCVAVSVVRKWWENWLTGENGSLIVFSFIYQEGVYEQEGFNMLMLMQSQTLTRGNKNFIKLNTFFPRTKSIYLLSLILN